MKIFRPAVTPLLATSTTGDRAKSTFAGGRISWEGNNQRIKSSRARLIPKDVGASHHALEEAADAPSPNHITFVDAIYVAGTFNMPTSYQYWVWESEAHINWSMVTCEGSTRLELP